MEKKFFFFSSLIRFVFGVTIVFYGVAKFVGGKAALASIGAAGMGVFGLNYPGLAPYLGAVVAGIEILGGCFFLIQRWRPLTSIFSALLFGILVIAFVVMVQLTLAGPLGAVAFGSVVGFMNFWSVTALPLIYAIVFLGMGVAFPNALPRRRPRKT